MSALIIFLLAILAPVYGYCFYKVAKHILYLIQRRRSGADAKDRQAAYEALEACIRLDQIARNK